ncbi:MAG: lysophospholipid acyltransferase family protein [Spirochaetia bacterium]
MSILQRIKVTKARKATPTNDGNAPKNRRLFFAVIRLAFGLWLRPKFRMHSENESVLRNTRPPFLVLPNHVGFWDPFLVGLKLPGQIHYIVADSNFRNPILRFLLTYIDAIPKTKSRSDMDSVRKMMSVRDHGGVICLFPEGRRTWDGRSLPPIQSTAKLVKLLKIPVIAPVLEGMYLSNPCWATKVRPGPITIRFHRLFDGPELRGMSSDEIYEAMRNALDYDEHAAQYHRRRRYKGSRRAEYLERVLHTCPACGEIGNMESHVHTLRCTSCGHTVQLNDQGFFEAVSGPVYFSDPGAWNKWQIQTLDSYIRSNETDHYERPLFSDSGIQLSIGWRAKPLEHVGFGTMRCYTDRIEFLCRRPTKAFRHPAGRFSGVESLSTEQGLLLVFPLNEIVGWNVQNKEHFEWYHHHMLFRVRRPDNRFSGYKWYSTINLLLGRHPQAAHIARHEIADADLPGEHSLP